MLYYDFKVTINDKIEKLDINEASNGQMNSNVAILNEKQKYNVRFYINGIELTVKQNAIVHLCGVIGYKNNDDPKELAKKFVIDLGFDVVDIEGDETTVKNFANLIKRAERLGFVDDTDSILEMCAPGNFRTTQSPHYEEKLIEDMDAPDEVILKKADDLCCSNLKEEVERILAMPAESFMGHPVHYILKVDSSDLMILFTFFPQLFTKQTESRARESA